MKRRLFGISAVLLVFLLSLSIPFPARADVAPPEQPPGANIMPGSTTTQVRMLAETVTLTVLSKPSASYPGQAKTEADFTMRNLGSAEEKMQARFPLTFWNDHDNGFGQFPEIPDIQISVDGNTVPTHRIDATYTPSGGVALARSPWAAFDITFPPGKDVNITVKYTTNGYGYDPVFNLRYVLETGAGWNGTIGSADIIVKLPYPASQENVLLRDDTGIPSTTAGAQISGNQVTWHFADFEPTSDNNITASLVTTSAWQSVLDWRAQTQKTPNDGEAWGQLGKAIKTVIRGKHGEIRADAGSEMLYTEALAAYDKSVTLLPKDALWHYGYADLLLAHAAYSQATIGGDYSELSHGIGELRQSLALAPNNQSAKDTAAWIQGLFPWALTIDGNNYDFLILTATPTRSSDVTTIMPEASSTPEPGQPVTTEAPATPVPTSAGPTVEPAPTHATFPASCTGAVGAFFLPVLAGLLWLFSKRH